MKSRFSGLAMLQVSSRQLVQVIGREIAAQLCTILPEFGFTIVASKLAYASNRHELLWIYVQSCSMMLQKDELIKINAICLKKLKENFERKV